MSTGIQGAERAPRKRQTTLDMVRSLAVVAAVVAAIVLLVPRPDGPIDRAVPVEQVAASSAADADFVLTVPDLPEGWEPNSVRLDAAGPDANLTWHVGYVTPSGGYAGLERARDVTSGWVSEQTNDGRRDDEAASVDIAGETWQLLRSTEPERTSLVIEREGVTTVVTGSAPVSELYVLAEAV